ncbi:hypothetical protein [Halegenticoccus tardaugens]|uniref:hypothetical protein n=1 Tax=Halegenticoccus tardaugens TaxID=2071624 RepID=UPI00100BFA44|nr:hypothetical protein [Halegenticoccus tardaugens]
MDRSQFVRLSLLAFGLVLLSFLLLGTTRIFLPFRVSQLIAAPVVASAFLLVVYLFVRATLSAVGVNRIEK